MSFAPVFCEALGPVVQSIVSLTMLLRQFVKYMRTRKADTLLFFVGKM